MFSDDISLGAQITYIVYWILWLSAVCCSVYSKKYVDTEREAVIILTLIVLIRNSIPLYDFDEKRFTMEHDEIVMFVLIQLSGSQILQICINFISSPLFSLLFTLVFTTFNCLGGYKMLNSDKDSLKEIFMEDGKIAAFIWLTVNAAMGLLFVQWIILFGQKHVLQLWNLRDIMVH